MGEFRIPDISLLCVFVHVQDSGTANCFDWLSFGGTQFKTTGFDSITTANTGFECLDRQDCCKFTPKAGPALLWADSAPFNDFSNSSLSEYIPGRFSQHRMKYMANAYDATSFKGIVYCFLHNAPLACTLVITVPCIQSMCCVFATLHQCSGCVIHSGHA